MIHKITFENYKVFKEQQELKLKPITILIGKNSSGKSALLRLIVMLWKSLGKDMDYSGPMDSPLVYHWEDFDFAGTFKDLVYKKLEARPLRISLDIEDIEGLKHLDVVLRYYEELRAGVIEDYILETNTEKFRFQLNLNKVTQKERAYDISFLSYPPNDLKVQFNGLAFDFIFPNEAHSTWDKRAFPHSIFNLNYLEPLRPIIKRLYHRVEDKNRSPYLLFQNEDLLKKVAQWYKEKLNVKELTVKEISHTGYFSLMLNDLVNLKDTGQGIGQSLPIVTHALRGEENTLHIIEQPELHLHPAAHREIAQLMAESVKNTSNSKFLIETHSENFILRLRKLVVEGVLSPDDLAIYSVEYEEEKEASCLKEIVVDEMGEVSYWPEGVFSESFEEVKAIGLAQYEKSN